MKCCDNQQIANVVSKCSDMCHVEYPTGIDSDSYVPYDIGLGGGDYMRFSYCMNCGKIQGKFPVEAPKSELDED